MPHYPSPDEWIHATANQKNRANRSFTELKKRSVPVYFDVLQVPDDNVVKTRSPQDVARRTIILWAVELRAEGVPLDEARQMIDHLDLWEYVSPMENQFLDNDEPSAEECQTLVWRLEALWILMWSLGHIDELSWPSGMCDVPQLAELLTEYEDDPNFIAGARLLAKNVLIDAQNLTMRLYWAVRDAYLHQGGMLPENLDWSSEPDWIPASYSAAIGVIEQRHRTLNWIVNYSNPVSWDDVDTPT